MEFKAKAVQLKARLVALQDEEREIEKELRTLQGQVQPKAKYGNLQVTLIPDYVDWNKQKLGEAVRLVVLLLNAEDKVEHLAIFGSISGDWKESRVSVTYYRNEYGVLNHTSGGWILLKDGIPCSDAEWESIKRGDIPDKFRTSNLE